MPEVFFKNGSAFSYPSSWQIMELHEAIILSGPENDIQVHFLVLPWHENNLEKIWQKLKFDFTSKISQRISLATTLLGGFWEEIDQIIYDIPPSDSKIVMALVRRYQNEAYINLIEAKLSAFERRSAELSQMTESWQPSNIELENLNDNGMQIWQEAEHEAFDNFIKSNMATFKIPGFAINIVHASGNTLYSKAYGVKKVGNSEEITLDTPFMIGSTTKALTTLMMGVTVDQKKITWETPVCDVLKSFKLGDEALSRQLNAKLTVSASTGMPRRDFDFIFRYSDITPEDRLKQMQEMKPTTALGETFQYSNLLFMTGGYMAAHAYAPSLSLQEAYAQCLDELILKPLGMNQSTLSIDTAIAKGAAFPHSLNIEGELREIPMAIEKSCASVAPSGALWSTVNDMSQYLLLELNHGIRHGKQIISPENLLERRKPGIKMSDKACYGLGLILSNEQGLQMVSHGGGTLGFASDLCFYPEKEIGLVMMTNSRYGHAFLYAVKQKFLELSFHAKPRAETAIKMGLSQQLEMVRKIKQNVSVLAQDMQWIKEYLGEYTNRHLGCARITETQSGFTIACSEWQSRLAVETDHKGKHYLVLIDPPFPGLLKFQATECGELVLDAGQEQYRFTKKEKLSLEQSFSCTLMAKKQRDASTNDNSEYQDETDKHERNLSKNRYFK